MEWPKLDTTPVFANARIISISADKAAGEISIQADFSGRQQTEIVYEGVFCSQLDMPAGGLFVSCVDIITLAELGQDKYARAAKKLHDEEGQDDEFLRCMLRRGNNLYVHHTDRGDFIVLARRLCYGETVALAPIRKENKK